MRWGFRVFNLHLSNPLGQSGSSLFVVGDDISLSLLLQVLCVVGVGLKPHDPLGKKIPAQKFAAGRNFLCEDALQDAIISAVQQRQAQVNEQKIYRSAYFGGGWTCLESIELQAGHESIGAHPALNFPRDEYFYEFVL